MSQILLLCLEQGSWLSLIQNGSKYGVKIKDLSYDKFSARKNNFCLLCCNNSNLHSLSACSSGPESKLEGKWELDWYSSSSENLYGDLNLVKERASPSWVIRRKPTESSLCSNCTGKDEITTDDAALVADFSVEGDFLTIKFEDGKNYYQRVEVAPETEDEETLVWSDPEETGSAHIATQSQISDTDLSVSTPKPTNTSVPVVVQQPTATKTPNFTPTPKVLFSTFRMCCFKTSCGRFSFHKL